MIGSGTGNKVVASRLGLSIETVKFHVHKIDAKLIKLYPSYQPRERIILYFREHMSCPLPSPTRQ